MGDTYASFIRELRLDPSRGGVRSDAKRLQEQMRRLFSAAINFQANKIDPAVEKALIQHGFYNNVLISSTASPTTPESPSTHVFNGSSYTACGFRNTDTFKTAIYFHCAGLDLFPVTH